MSEKKGQKDDGGYWLDDREYIMPDVKSRQSVKHEPVVTRDEIAETAMRSMTTSPTGGIKTGKEIIDIWAELFKSKGVEVRDDKNQG